MTSVARFSLCVLLASVVVQAIPPVGTADIADTACTVGQSCTPGLPQANPVRGLCTSKVVGATTGDTCWDACNTDHPPLSYSLVDGQKQGIALMVKQFRTGMRGADSCAGALLEQTCNPGERCTPPGWTWGRGMCVASAPPANLGNQCLDMCDTSIDISMYRDTPGKQAGTVNIVNQVRAGRDPKGLVTCPITGAMLWLLIPLTLCCCVGLVGGAAWVFNYMRQIRRKANQKNQNYREPEQQFLEEAQYGYGEGTNMQPEEQYQQRDYAAEPMPVMEPMVEAPVMQAQEPQMNIFGGAPNLMGGLAPQTVAAPTTMYPSLAAPMTAAYPTNSYQLPAQQGYAQAGSSYVTGSQRAPGGSQFGGSMALTGGATATQMPAYGAYGAYGGQAVPQMVSQGLNQTVYPTGSMRIG